MTEPEQIPAHPFIKPVPPASLEGRTCFACGLGYIEGRTFVAVTMQLNHDIEAEAVPPGLILTKDEQADRVVIRHRNPFSGKAEITTLEALPVFCRDCVVGMAQQLGVPPATDVVLNEAAEARERAEKAEQELAELRLEWEAARRGFRTVQDVKALAAAIGESESATTTRKPRKRRQEAAA